MHTTSLTLVTIVAESLLQNRLIDEITAAGAKGYTLTPCEGSGSRHRRVSELLGANIKLETIVSNNVADKLMTVLAKDYFPKFAIIAYLQPAAVIRGDKYV